MGHWIGIRNTVDIVRGSVGLWSLLCIHRDEGPGKSMGHWDKRCTTWALSLQRILLQVGFISTVAGLH